MIAITGATGQLGQIVITELIRRQIQPHNIVALVRDREKATGLINLGVQIRIANYDSLETLEKAFTGIDKVLLISGSEVGRRLPQHQNVITAAKKSNVKVIAYTSILKADTSKMILAQEHLATEKAIRESGIPYIFLRNSWYIENYTSQVKSALQNGVAGSAGNGKVSAASRADYAAAAASALLNNKLNVVYELAGESFTLSDYAKELSHQSHKPIAYHDMPELAFENLLKQIGLPEGLAHALADSDTGILRGDLYSESKDLQDLIGRPPLTLSQVLKSALPK